MLMPVEIMDHVHACNKIAGTTAAHSWTAGDQAPLSSFSGHSVRSQAKVTASAGRGDTEMVDVDYLDNGHGLTKLVLKFVFRARKTPSSARRV